MLKIGSTSVIVEEWSGSQATTEENIERVHTMILDNWRVIINDVAHHLLISHGSAH
jgi:hypothetical protein